MPLTRIGIATFFVPLLSGAKVTETLHDELFANVVPQVVVIVQSAVGAEMGATVTVDPFGVVTFAGMDMPPNL